jgi:nanoRNase/pAp phosphatase (c-di-AMP/oligoRNAs hydrolase)
MEAYRALLPYVDKIALARAKNYPLPKVIFETEAKAFKNKEIRNTALISFVGEVTAYNRDIIPSIVDRFVRMDGINTAVILGIIDDKLIASVRSNDGRVDVNTLCAQVFGKDNGGGKEGSGGAMVPLGFAYQLLIEKKEREECMDKVIVGLKNKIFKALGEENSLEEGV